ncbi:prepilin-type N-terminal cleavage/methylation domain-containing protein [uncultured Microbulbifer sp.]|uniref:prepilin-type N-terminal cleavage/methylation domain-containing protein n=1 Tax=uncultured Microbulbifer sp. TaxID=348147 RepID=UPI0026250607|nr:prepilin-type N-terminal cleavage/methylation domain-containing protein [uncultured Microbulbifer sp.]
MYKRSAQVGLQRNRGFTLVEILVVIVIIASLAGMAMMSLGSSGVRVWEGETQRLSALLQLVADRALIDKTHYGVVLKPESYIVVRFDPSSMTWQAPDMASASRRSQRFATHEFPANVRLEVLEGADLPSTESTEFAEEESDEEDTKPQFVALSSGEVLPVKLAVFLIEDGDFARGATISYSSLYGLQLEWQADDL